MKKPNPSDGTGFNVDIWNGSSYVGSLYRSGSTSFLDQMNGGINGCYSLLNGNESSTRPGLMDNPVWSALFDVPDFLKNHTGAALAMIFEKLQLLDIDGLNKKLDQIGLAIGALDIKQLSEKLDKIIYMLDHRAQ